MKHRSISMLILVLVIVLSACASGAPTKGEVTVFVAGPLSGFQANTGQTITGGVRLMAEQLNRSGGLLGYKVKVVALDDEADSDVAVSVAEEIKAALDRGDKVLGVIGHPNSGQTAAAMAIYKDLPIIVITPTASEVGLTHQGYRNFFRVNASNDVQANVGAEYLVNNLGASKVAVLYNDDPYGIPGQTGRQRTDPAGRPGAGIAPGAGRTEPLPRRGGEGEERGGGRGLLRWL